MDKEPPTVPCPYQPQLDKAFQEIKRLYIDSASEFTHHSVKSSTSISWKKSITSDSAAVSTLKSSTSDNSIGAVNETTGSNFAVNKPGKQQCPIARGDCTFPSKYSLEDIITAINDPVSRKNWDHFYLDRTDLEYYDSERHSGLAYTMQKGQPPLVKHRDFIIAQCKYMEVDTEVDATDGGKSPREIVYLIQTSVDDENEGGTSRFSHLKSKQTIRGRLHCAGWMIRGVDGGGWAVTYIVHVDLNGRLPAGLLKLIATETPACVGKLLACMG